MAINGHRRRLWIGISIVLTAALVLFIIVPQQASFASSMQALRSARPEFVAAAIGLSLLPCLLAAFSYRLLSSKRLNLLMLTLVQLSGLLINRVIPAGLGGIGLNIWYLRQKRLTVAQAATITGLNNLIGVIGNVVLTLCTLALSGSQLAGLANLPEITMSPILLIVIVPIVIATVLVMRRYGMRFLRQCARELRRLRTTFVNKPERLIVLFILACLIALCNTAAFWVSCLAVGATVNFALCYLVLSLGVLVGTAVPTPGGLGGVEAALVAGLIGLSVPAPMALAAVLLYRLCSYWIGLVIGTISFGIFTAKSKQ